MPTVKRNRDIAGRRAGLLGSPAASSASPAAGKRVCPCQPRVSSTIEKSDTWLLAKYRSFFTMGCTGRKGVGRTHTAYILHSGRKGGSPEASNSAARCHTPARPQAPPPGSWSFRRGYRRKRLSRSSARSKKAPPASEGRQDRGRRMGKGSGNKKKSAPAFRQVPISVTLSCA